MARLTLRREWLPLCLVAASWILVAYFWPQLPDVIPTHWGADGRPNGWMPRPWGAVVGPVVTTFLYVLGLVMPRIDPRLARREGSDEVYAALRAILSGFGCFVTYLVLSTAASGAKTLDVGTLWVGMGLLFIMLGNYMPKLRPNFLMGIRTPWTLSSEQVWYDTHRVGGRVMVVAGLLLVLVGFLPIVVGAIAGLVLLLGTSLGTVGYSYWRYQSLGRPGAR